MSKITAKRVLRAMRPLREAAGPQISVAQESRAVESAIKRAQQTLDRIERNEKTVCIRISELIADVQQLSKDAGETLNHLMDDLGRSGADPRCSAMDNLQDQLSDMDSELTDAWDALGRQGRIVKPGKGTNDLTAASAQASIRKIRSEARSHLKTLEKMVDDAEAAYHALENAVADLENEEVYAEYEEKFERTLADLEDVRVNYDMALDRLESV